jgi:hypothetical protein
MDKETGQKVLELRERIVSRFDAGDWEEVGLRTGFDDIISGHNRLLRSLSWGDEDYSGNVLTVLRQMTQRDPAVLDQLTAYLDEKYPGESHFISAKPSERKLTFAPHVFEIPPVLTVEHDLATAMMPFGSGFAGTHEAIKGACQDAALRCVRADDIWENATIIQDIFNLIIRARVVIVDFTGKNPNVMYETGIAHTLGKLVVPITQSLDDVPFDIRHHRVLKYLPNTEGYAELRKHLGEKLSRLDR